MFFLLVEKLEDGRVLYVERENERHEEMRPKRVAITLNLLGFPFRGVVIHWYEEEFSCQH